MPIAQCKCGAYVSAKIPKCRDCGARMAPAPVTSRRSKYGNKKTASTIEGQTHKFDSKGEGWRAKMLEILMLGGEITDLKLQPKFTLIPECDPPITYTPDFQYRENGKLICEDFKSEPTLQSKAFRLTLRLWKWRGPYPLKLTMKKKGSLIVVKMIPKGIDV